MRACGARGATLDNIPHRFGRKVTPAGVTAGFSESLSLGEGVVIEVRFGNSTGLLLSSFTDPGGTITGGLITRRCSMVTHLMQRFLEQESAEHAPTHSLRSDMAMKSIIQGSPKVLKEGDAGSHAMNPSLTSMSHRPHCTLLRGVGLRV